MLTDANKGILFELHTQGKSAHCAAKLTGLPRSTIRGFYASLATKAGFKPILANEGEKTFLVDENPKTLEDLIRVCEIDLEAFEVVSYEVNKWETASMSEREIAVALGQQPAKIRDGLVSKAIYQIKVKLKPRVPGRVTPDELCTRLAKSMARNAATVHSDYHRTTLIHEGGKHLLEVDPFDVHFGKYCWRRETETDYDMEIAAKLFKYAVEDLIEKASGFPIDRILLPIGNDVLHSDGPKNQTYAGTPMDMDSRFAGVFERTHELHSWAIRRLMRVAPVDVVVIPGNHDTTAAWHLGHVLATEFKNEAWVTVDNAPKTRKYYLYGKNLLGFTHGDKGKEADLPTLMALEVPKLWAESEHREWHIGHKHKYSELKWRSAESYHGTIVRTLNTITAQDAWHAQQGYSDRRAMQAFVHNLDTGFVGMFHANVFRDGSIPA